MTQREKFLASGLLAVLVLGGGGAMMHMFVLEPVSQVRTQLNLEREELSKRQSELTDLENEIGAVQNLNPRLIYWNQLSVPPLDPALKKLNLTLDEQRRRHLANMRVAYEQYLSNLMGKAGFRSIKVVAGQSRSMPTPSGGLKPKDPPYQQLTFDVGGEGTMENVTRFMTAFNKTPLLHHIRSMKLGLASEKKSEGPLKMDASVDALMMATGEERTELVAAKPPSPRVLAEGREYLLLDKVNMFTGYTPPRVVRETKKEDTKKTENPMDVLRFVKVTGFFYDPERKRWEATLYDQGKGGREKLVNAGSRDEFTIVDKDENPMLAARVLKVDEGFLIIQADGKYHRLELGDFIYPAIRKSLSRSELRELGITPDESEQSKKKETTKTTEEDEKEDEEES